MTADTVSFWANWLLVASLVVGVAATFVIIVSGNIKEKELRRELSQAKVDAEKAKATAAEANTKTAALNLQVEEVARKRIEAELALETLRAKLRGRSLTPEQRKILLRELRKLPETQITVGLLGDKEANDFAEQIIAVLIDAGLQVARFTFGIMSPPRYGIILSSNRTFSAFHAAFKKAKVDFETGQVPRADIVILVGLKPPLDT